MRAKALAGPKDARTLALKTWSRPEFTPSEAAPELLYAVFGDFPSDWMNISGGAYNTAGVPEGIDLFVYEGPDRAVFDWVFEGPVGAFLQSQSPEAFARAQQSPQAIVLRGAPADPSTLDYLRDAVGIATAAAEKGGVAVFDNQSVRLWSPEAWRKGVFDAVGGDGRAFAHILVSEESDGTWLHTRGMRLFGRPDLSLRGVRADWREGAIELVNRLIAYQAAGAIVPDGRQIRMEPVPGDLVCRTTGSYEDPDFNNLHIRIAPE